MGYCNHNCAPNAQVPIDDTPSGMSVCSNGLGQRSATVTAKADRCWTRGANAAKGKGDGKGKGDSKGKTGKGKDKGGKGDFKGGKSGKDKYGKGGKKDDADVDSLKGFPLFVSIFIKGLLTIKINERFTF